MLNELLGLIGREPKTELPPVNALTEEDLERIAWAARQRGDLGKVGRVDDVRRMRSQRPVSEYEQGLNDRNAEKEKFYKERSERMRSQRPQSGPGLMERAVDTRQELLDALLTRPRR